MAEDRILHIVNPDRDARWVTYLAALPLQEDIAAMCRSVAAFQATRLVAAERNIPAFSGNRTLVTNLIATCDFSFPQWNSWDLYSPLLSA